MRSLFYIATFFCGIAGLIIEFCYVLRSGKIVKGVIIGWGLSIICVFLVSVVLPAIVAVYDSEYIALFPEAIGVPFVMIGGWVSALIVALLARLVKRGIEHWAKTSRPVATR